MEIPYMQNDIFYFIMIRPTHYADDGYPIRWWKPLMPSNTLAVLNGLAEDCKQREILGPNVDIRTVAMDEAKSGVNIYEWIEKIKKENAKALVGMVGVQSNQFPRAVDLSELFLKEGIPVCIGGFHVSGSLSMFKEMPEELIEAQNKGISLVAGEVEGGRLDVILQDAYHSKLKPLYHFLNKLPSITNVPIPFLNSESISNYLHDAKTFDVGRGCPFSCSFCTIINVQGKQSRFRSADDVEKILRKNAENGVTKYFITDDNFARNQNWEVILDRIIELKENEGFDINIKLQVDMQCYKIPGFVEKCVRAGVFSIFIGMESINPGNIAASGKKHNKVQHYKEMINAWKDHSVFIVASYIIGMPNDTYESVMRDIDTIKREFAVDVIYFTMLTPLPGSQDHKEMVNAGQWIDSDLNKYDLYHRVAHHPIMSDEEWEKTYKMCWERFYTYEHMHRILLRKLAIKPVKQKLYFIDTIILFREYMRLYGIHPTDTGILRYKNRFDRRKTFPIEGPVTFRLRYFFGNFYRCSAIILTYLRVTSAFYLFMLFNRKLPKDDQSR